MELISWDDFMKVELRVGRIVRAEPFLEARKPAYVLQVDFGPEIGQRKSSAQITHLYAPDDLVGKLVVAVVNFPKKQVGRVMSECDAGGACRVGDHCHSAGDCRAVCGGHGPEGAPLAGCLGQAALHHLLPRSGDHVESRAHACRLPGRLGPQRVIPHP